MRLTPLSRLKVPGPTIELRPEFSKRAPVGWATCCVEVNSIAACQTVCTQNAHSAHELICYLGIPRGIERRAARTHGEGSATIPAQNVLQLPATQQLSCDAVLEVGAIPPEWRSCNRPPLEVVGPIKSCAPFNRTGNFKKTRQQIGGLTVRICNTMQIRLLASVQVVQSPAKPKAVPQRRRIS